MRRILPSLGVKNLENHGDRGKETDLEHHQSSIAMRDDDQRSTGAILLSSALRRLVYMPFAYLPLSL